MSLIGKYVIIRCHDAGVHFGKLVSFKGRQAVLRNSRRLWYWYPLESKWLDAVAVYGLREESKLGPTNPNRKILTENCEIIECSKKAKRNIKEFKENGEESKDKVNG